MKKIIDNRIAENNGKFEATCTCGKKVVSKYKNTVVNVLARGNCSKCVSYAKPEEGIYLNDKKQWCSTCPSCGIEQAYTRKQHARASHRNKCRCKSCANNEGAFKKNNSVGSEQRYFNKFSKMAKGRGIDWEITKEEMFAGFNGKCSLTGWDISIDYGKSTASLDRIDSNKGYTVDNIQWVHSLVNMSKGKTEQKEFIEMCKAISDKVKW